MPLVHILDLGNVLIAHEEGLFYERVRERGRAGAPVVEVVNRHLEELAVDIGGDFDQLHPRLVQDLGLTMSLAELRLAWNDIFTPIGEMIELAAAMPRPRYLLSTTNEPHVTWLREHYGYVFDLFDHCFLTCEIGLRKPDLALFRHAESVTQQPPERHVFVDDREENVAGARAAGWHAFQFAGVEDCRRRLAELAGR